MELRVEPEDLHVAALALSRCATSLADAAIAFARCAEAAIPELGQEAALQGYPSATASERAVGVLTADINQLSGALEALAGAYPQVDASAVPLR